MQIRIREIIFMLVLLAMPVSSWWFVFKPQNQEIAKAKGEILHKEQLLDKLAAATAATADLQLRKSALIEQITLVESQLPSGEELDLVLHQVADIARQQRLEIMKVKTATPITNSNYSEQPLEMVIRGDFDDFYVFLQEIEKLPRLTRIPDFDIARSAKDDGITTVKMTLSVFFEASAKGA